MHQDAGWASLFSAAFKASRNPMMLVDDRRYILDANRAFFRLLGRQRRGVIGRPLWEFVEGGPLYTPQQWTAALDRGRLTGQASMLTAADATVTVQWGASVEVVTGRRLVLFVALSTSRWGERFRRETEKEIDSSESLSPREKEIVHLVALGLTGPEIADELHISHDTVRTHVRNAMTKLNARSRAHLVARALAEGHTLG
ncbi:MAG TPA: LuxR C-terminal-related transcriptional regulator [Thermoleophilaceae bacterium]|nr:LuxR C-terminal-related transcriptional regulator [Thermoleophilaceae bacterium]